MACIEWINDSWITIRKLRLHVGGGVYREMVRWDRGAGYVHLESTDWATRGRRAGAIPQLSKYISALTQACPHYISEIQGRALLDSRDWSGRDPFGGNQA